MIHAQNFVYNYDKLLASSTAGKNRALLYTVTMKETPVIGFDSRSGACRGGSAGGMAWTHA